MRIFCTKNFAKWARKEKVPEASLISAVAEIDHGLIDARMGQGLVKKRIAAPGRGKSGSWRTIIAYRVRDKAFFLHGFAKNEKANVTSTELHWLKSFSRLYLTLGNEDLAKACSEGVLVEIRHGGKNGR